MNLEKVMLWVGAGQIGMAIARRIGYGMKIIVVDKNLEFVIKGLKRNSNLELRGCEDVNYENILSVFMSL